jgi:myo-inositol 2-dehydrogenase/D-chiro-inositol 1-dehydrogenase
MSDTPTLKYGLIGSGMMGIEHMLNLRLLPDVELVAIADPNETSQKWGRDTAGEGVAIHDDPKALLERDDLDAVIISTPNFTHAEVLRDVFQTDLHVLCEKPLCTTLEDCQYVVDAAEKHRGVFWVAMEYRYMPPVTRMIDELQSGAIGQLRMLSIREHRLPFLKKVGDWNRFSRNTGGTLVEKCCHFFDLMRLMTQQEPVRVYASGAQDVNHLDERYDGEIPDILDNAYTVVDFDGGARAALDLCMFAEATRNEQEIAAVGDAGKLECFIPESKLVRGRRSEPRAIETEKIEVEERILKAGFHHGATYFQHLAFRQAIRSGKAPDVSARDGLLAVAMGAAAQRSIELGRPVEIAELLGGG